MNITKHRDFFIIFSLFIVFITIHINAEEDSIFKYFTEEQKIVYITYASYNDLVEFAKAFNIPIVDSEGKPVELEALRKALYNKFGFEVTTTKNAPNILFIKRSDVINYMTHNDNDKIELLGNIYVVYGGKIIKADKIIIYVEEQLIWGKGNIFFQDGGTYFYGDEFEYNMKTNVGSFTNISGYVDTYYITSTDVTAVDQNTVIMAQVTATPCSYRNPHFYIKAKKVHYSSEIIIFYEMELYVGESLVFYSPIYFSFERGAGFPLQFGMNYAKRQGLMIFLTLNQADSTWFFDYYERMGFFTEFIYKPDKSKVNFISGFAISPDIFYLNNYDYWTIFPPDGNFTFDNLNFRIGGKFSYNGILSQDISFITSLEYFSDPYFYNDFFSTARDLKFKIMNFLKTGWETTYPSIYSSLNESFSLQTKLLGYSLNYSIGLSFVALRNNAMTNTEYIYTPEYYSYQPQSIKPLDIAFSGILLSINTGWMSFSITNSNRSSYLIYLDKNWYESYHMHSLSSSLANSLLFNFKPFTYSVSFNPGINYNFNSSNVNEEQLLGNFTLSNTVSINLGIFSLSASVSQNYNYNFNNVDLYPWTSNKANLQLGINPFSWFYLNSNLSYDFLDIPNRELFVFDTERFTELNTNTGIKTSVVSVRFSNTYNITIQKSIKDLLGLNIVFSKIYLGDMELYIYDNLNIYLDYMNPFNQYMTNSFGLQLNLKDEFSLNMSIQSRNSYIYYYYGNWELLFQHLLNSFNIFDTNALNNTWFVLDNITVSLLRNLHRFTLGLSASGRFSNESSTSEYKFLVTFSIFIVSIDYADLKFELTQDTY